MENPVGKYRKQRETFFFFYALPAFFIQAKKVQVTAINSQTWWRFKRTGSPRTFTWMASWKMLCLRPLVLGEHWLLSLFTLRGILFWLRELHPSQSCAAGVAGGTSRCTDSCCRSVLSGSQGSNQRAGILTIVWFISPDESPAES